MNNRHFNYVEPNRWIQMRENDRLANQNATNKLNEYVDVIKTAATFYKNNLSNCKIDYVYKDKKGISVLPVKYKQENFPHLNGINIPFVSANKKFDILLNGNNTLPLVIEKGNRTFDKLKLLPKLPELLDSNSTVLNNLQSVKQARKIGFDDAIKNQDKDLLLALQSFDPEFYTPKSLLNITNNKRYEGIPENTVLGIFKEKNIENGIKIEPLSLNKDSLDNIATTTEMLIGMKKYADELGKQRIKERNVSGKKQVSELSKEKKHAKKLTVKVDPRAREIALRRMRNQGLER